MTHQNPIRLLQQGNRIYETTRSFAVEAFNLFNVNIEFLSVDENKGIKTILMTSPFSSEGKSMVTVNLAATMANANKKVLLIDGDMRRPTIHRYFSLINSKGLSDIVLNDISIGELAKSFDDKNESGLSVLPSGRKPPNPSEILGSNKMAGFLNAIRDSYDYIIIDTPPVLLVPDALSLSRHVDGVIIVNKFGKTRDDMAKKAKEALDLVNAKLLGVVLNFTPSHKRYGYSKYNYGYYNYGYYHHSDRQNTAAK